jgi:hypothetical protein
VFFGVIVEKEEDDDDDDLQKLKSIEDQFYGDESQGVQVKVTYFAAHLGMCLTRLSLVERPNTGPFLHSKRHFVSLIGIVC